MSTLRLALTRRRTGSLAWHLGAVAILAVILYPVVWVIGASFKPSKDVINSLTLFPSHPILSNFKGLADGIADVPIRTFFQNSSSGPTTPPPTPTPWPGRCSRYGCCRSSRPRPSS
ncbi:hypothetical protein SRB17_70610 [Streptomyces sp. RB17]|nr:hypothetical protein [Streptomyces sp. RB17]